MPFKSEKQRRFLWLKHPDIAKRWAHEYPNQKKLPMRVNDKKDENEKKAVLDVLQMGVVNNSTPVLNIVPEENERPTVKKSNSILETVEMPQDSKPTYAGEKAIVKHPKPETEDEGSIGKSRDNSATCQTANLVENPVIQKLAVVLSPKIQQLVEQQRADAEARNAVRVPQNVNLKQYPQQSNVIPPPMGMAQAPAQQAPQPAQQQPQQQQPPNGQYASVGGGNTPNANPINAFGGLSTNGDINGNAALGTQNMAGGEKLAAIGLWDRIRAKKQRGEKPAKPGDKDYPDAKSWKKVTSISEKKSEHEQFRGALMALVYKYAEQKCSCGCGDTPSTCKCPDSCSCRQKGGSCYKAEKKASSPAWQRSEGKNEEGGLNAKGRASYNKATGGHLKAPVTEKNPTGKAKKRRHSFCSRMCGMKRVNTGASTAKDPDSRINKSLRKWNCKCSSAMSFGEKIAIDIERGGLPSRALASTVGQVGGVLAGLPIMSLKNHVNPTDWEGASGSMLDHHISREDERAQKLKHIAEVMEKVNPQELGGHRVVLGGTRIDRDIPRIFTNPRTSLLGKALGVATYPVNALLGNLFRGSHYNPFTDTSHVYGNSPAVLSHELGHALDFNSTPVPGYSDSENPVKTWFRRQGRGLMRDGYMLSRAFSPIMLKQEAQANLLSEKNLRKALGKEPELLNEVFDDRQRELPVGMGSYVGAAASPFLGPAGGVAPLAGMIAGRSYGQAEADRMKGRWARTPKHKHKKEDKKEDKKEQELAKAASEPVAKFDVKNLIDSFTQFPKLRHAEEPGFANTYSNPTMKNILWQTAAAAPLGLAAAGLTATMMSDKSPQKTDKVKKKERRPKANVKKADVASTLNTIRGQLPGLHTVDTLAGTLGGAALGGLYDVVRGNSARLPENKRWRSTARRVLGGALLGGLGANFAGDRARRYISNTLLPFGYDNEALKNVVIKPTDLKKDIAQRWKDWRSGQATITGAKNRFAPERDPDTISKIWDAAVLDKPHYDLERLKTVSGIGNYGGTIDSRREIMRRSFGVHANNVKTDWWQKNPGGYYSLNEQHPDYIKRLRLLFGPENQYPATGKIREFMETPDKALTAYNTADLQRSQANEYDFFGSGQINGDQQIPFAVHGPRVDAQVLDRFDLTPNPNERKHLMTWLKKKLSGKGLEWMKQKDPEGHFDYKSRSRTNEELAKTIGARWLWDNVLSEELPWISQKLTFTPNTPPPDLKPNDYNYLPYSMQFLRDSGLPAGDKIKTMDDLRAWLKENPLAKPHEMLAKLEARAKR